MLAKVLFLLFIIHSSHQSSLPSDPTYKAAVVEFNFGLVQELNAADRTKANLDKYIKLMEEPENDIDIIIFPEMTFNRMETAAEIPEPSEKVAPCDSDKYTEDNVAKKMSCSAKQYGRYVVANMITKAKCPDAEMTENVDPRDCKKREDGFSYYNTNVVFDRDGVVISRYRKFNLFGEEVDKPFKPQMATFTTDFGVKFGHFICFDLMFRYPAVELIRNHNVTDIIFPTMWFSEAPFLTAVQAQQNWAHSHNVNLLASGANFPAIGSTGTGIYGGNKGAYAMEMGGDNKTSVLVATVYKKIKENEDVTIEHKITKYTKNEMKTLKLKRDQLDVYDMTFLNDTDGIHSNEMKVCHGTTCCNIKVNYTIQNSATRKHYQYVMAFNHGQRTFDGFANGGIVACSILACSNNTKAGCGVRDENLENIHQWTSVEIDGKFPTKDEQFLYMPTSLDTSILPLQPEQFEYIVAHNENEDVIAIKLNGNAENLLAFGIYGRDFNLDVNGASGITVSISLILFAFLAIFKLM
ncbi:unnamed protein product [Chironomus riparius]|uniref:CN hydrolase domain-containing protein n=1 Tax=Chironomus riparius TaxID=315576 RepID=A0A9N9S733_9DIPT|nr:unnamed protein product [Chironomus riparius]